MKNFVIWILTPFIICAQESDYFTKDTSYTIYSAYQKLRSDYPWIRIAEPEINERIIVKQSIVYDSSCGRDLHMDIFSPAVSDNKLPAVILIHGGGWRSGDRSMQHPMAAELALNNFIAAAVEYRLSPEAKYPAAVLDLENAVRWIRKKASLLNVDENKIAVLGCSAGGTLAALLGTANRNKSFTNSNEFKVNLSSVQAVINIDGIVDFTHPAESGKDSDPSKPSAGKLWFGESFAENPQIWKHASPLNHVNEKSAPIIFINSSIERFHAGRDEMIEKLKTFNIHSEVFTIENTPHTFWMFHPWFGKTAEAAVKFLDKIFSR